MTKKTCLTAEMMILMVRSIEWKTTNLKMNVLILMKMWVQQPPGSTVCRCIHRIRPMNGDPRLELIVIMKMMMVKQMILIPRIRQANKQNFTHMIMVIMLIRIITKRRKIIMHRSLVKIYSTWEENYRIQKNNGFLQSDWGWGTVMTSSLAWRQLMST